MTTTQGTGRTISGTSGVVYLNGAKIGDVTHWEGTIPPRSQPTICDLSADAIACAILRQWARQPWAEVHRCALLDRMFELGLENRQKVAEAIRPGHGWFALRHYQRLPRRSRRLLFRQWRQVLLAAFGNFS